MRRHVRWTVLLCPLVTPHNNTFDHITTMANQHPSSMIEASDFVPFCQSKVVMPSFGTYSPSFLCSQHRIRVCDPRLYKPFAGEPSQEELMSNEAGLFGVVRAGSAAVHEESFLSNVGRMRLFTREVGNSSLGCGKAIFVCFLFCIVTARKLSVSECERRE
jgi:hypothetical protein